MPIFCSFAAAESKLSENYLYGSNDNLNNRAAIFLSAKERFIWPKVWPESMNHQQLWCCQHQLTKWRGFWVGVVTYLLLIACACSNRSLVCCHVLSSSPTPPQLGPLDQQKLTGQLFSVFWYCCSSYCSFQTSVTWQLWKKKNARQTNNRIAETEW